MSCRSSTVSVRLHDVPYYLRDGDFFHSMEPDDFQIEDDGFINVPADCLKSNAVITNQDDLFYLSKSLRFWLVRDVPDEAVQMCLSNLSASSLELVCSQFGTDFPVFHTLKSYLAADDVLSRLTLAARSGRLALLRHAIEKASPSDLQNPAVCRAAARYGWLQCLIYARDHGCAWDEQCCIEAAAGGHLSCLQYLHEHGCPWNLSVCSSAAGGGHLHCLKYAHEQGCAWGAETCRNAATAGSLECLKFAHERGCSWSRQTTAGAAHFGHLSCLQYAHEHGCAWDASTCEEAVFGGHLHCLRYAHEQGCAWDAAASVAAVEEGQVACLRYLLQHGGPIDENLVELAKSCGSMDCLALLIAQGMGDDAKGSVRGRLDSQDESEGPEEDWDITALPATVVITHVPLTVKTTSADVRADRCGSRACGSKPAGSEGFYSMPAVVAMASVVVGGLVYALQ